MVLLDATLLLVYELPHRCRFAHRRLARLGSPRSWSPRGADRAALPSAGNSQSALTLACHVTARRRFDSRDGVKIGGTTLKIRLGIQWNVSAKWDSLCA